MNKSLKQLRKMSLEERRSALQSLFSLSDKEMALLDSASAPFAERMVESSIGTFSIPLGVATGFLVDGEEFLIPLATEEPSVIAAATFAASLVQKGGGFKTQGAPSLLSAQIFILDAGRDTEKKLQENREEIQKRVNALIPRMVARGGGFSSLEFQFLKPDLLSITLELDVSDAMGANVVNFVAEEMKSYFCTLIGGECLMAIVTNSAKKRIASASFSLPERFFRGGSTTCKRIVLANQVAALSPDRAVTHNKGVMNGICALALATGNDTRAIEAAVHHFAGQKPLTEYAYEEGVLHGTITLPLPFATVGGAVHVWEGARLSLKLLGNPDAKRLTEIAASLGLAQNLAALYALVTEGIQRGHMELHAKRGGR